MAGFTICKQQCIFKDTFGGFFLKGPFLASAKKIQIAPRNAANGFLNSQKNNQLKYQCRLLIPLQTPNNRSQYFL